MSRRTTFLYAFLLAALAAGIATAGVVNDLDTGRRLAAEKNLPLVLDFSAKW